MEAHLKKFEPIDISRKNHNKSNYYIFYSIKNQRNIYVFSQLAYYNCLRLEMNPSVEIYCEYPCELSLEINNKLKHTILDFWIKYTEGQNEMQRLIDSKSKAKNNIITPKIQKEFLKEEAWCKEHNYRYSLITDIDIYKSGFYVHNLSFLYGLIKRIDTPIYDQYLIRVINILNSNKHLTIRDFISKDIILPNDLYRTIALGIYRGSLKMSIVSGVISHDTEVQINS